jgi:sigma-B regulation protein RsbU (phosphoserine phosphatase)
MQFLDLTANPKIDTYVSLLRDASRLTDPGEVQKRFAAMLRNDAMVQGFLSLSIRGLPQGQYKITRSNLDDDLGVVTQNPWQQWDLMPTHSGGFLGKIIETPEPKVIHDLDVRDDPVLGNKLARFGSCLVNPLFDDGQAINWSITFRLEPRAYTLADAEAFILRGNIIGRMTKTLVVANQVRELNAKLTAQLEQIAQIQRSLLPEQTPKVAGLEIATSYLTSNEAGGDYYDFFHMGHKKLGIIVADVSGHGAGAATVMAMLQTILHGFKDRDAGPAAMLEHANRELMSKKVESNFVTAYMAVLDLEKLTFTFANAGHHSPARRLADGRVTTIEGASSLPLGIIDDPEYPQVTTQLAKGDTLVFYTDGITEAFSPKPNKTMFGLDGLIGALRECGGQPMCVIESIHEHLFAHTRSRDRADDQTLVAIRLENN